MTMRSLGLMVSDTWKVSIILSRGTITAVVLRNAFFFFWSSVPKAEIINSRSCSNKIAGGRACDCLVPMHLQCGKSRPFLYSSLHSQFLTATTNRSSTASAFL